VTVYIQTKFASDTLTEEFSASAAVRIDKFTANNVDAAAQTLTVHVVPSGLSADDSNKQLVVEIEPGFSYLCGEIVGMDLEAGDSIHVLASTASTISIRSNGRDL
jgi:hypothetical protein